MDSPLTETRYIKHVFTDKERLEIGNKLTSAMALIDQKTDEIKTTTTAIKAEIAEQEGIINKCATDLRSGYAMRPRQCAYKIEGNKVVYVDKETGEVVEEHEMSEDEQLRLTGVRIDAETIIRQAREEED
jgi:hypothetical protein